MSERGPRKVLISRGFGGGWMTWNREYAKDFLFDSELIAAVEADEDLGREDGEGSRLSSFKARLVAKHGPDADHVYLGGSDGLVVEMVNGPFIVDEYDGAESISERDDTDWF